MKTSKLFANCSAFLFAVLSVQAQSFQDLNFESATLSPTTSQYGGPVPISAALPGWSGALGNDPVTQVLQNNQDFGSATIDIFGPNYPAIGFGTGFGAGIIDGNYTVFLQAGADQATESVVNTSLWQTGTIPADAQSLQFKAWNYNQDPASLAVSFAGNSLSPVLLSSTPNQSGIPVNLYGVNIAPYAGQTGELEFTSVILPNDLPSWNELDDITFSPEAVPEPCMLSLILMGGLALVTRRWRIKRA